MACGLDISARQRTILRLFTVATLTSLCTSLVWWYSSSSSTLALPWPQRESRNTTPTGVGLLNLGGVVTNLTNLATLVVSQVSRSNTTPTDIHKEQKAENPNSHAAVKNFSDGQEHLNIVYPHSILAAEIESSSDHLKTEHPKVATDEHNLILNTDENSTVREFTKASDHGHQNSSFSTTTQTAQPDKWDDIEMTSSETMATHDDIRTITGPATHDDVGTITGPATDKHKSLTGSASKGFIIVLHYGNQLESAVYDMYQLINVAAWWRMQVVEPFVHASLFGVPSTTYSRTILRFSDLYNLTSTNEKLRKCFGMGYPPIASLEAFAASNKKNAILVKLKRMSVYLEWCDKDATKKAEMSKDEKRINSNLQRMGKSQHFAIHPLHISSGVCINARHKINFRTLIGYITHSSQSALSTALATNPPQTLVFIDWNGIRSTPQPQFYYYDPTYRQKRCPGVHKFPHNSKVLSAALSFQKQLRLQKPYLGVHIRLEKLIKEDWKQPGHLELCIEKLLSTVTTAMSKYDVKTFNAVAFRDYGSAGSITCHNKGCNEVASKLKIDASLRALGVRVEEYKPTDFGTYGHSGFTSIVEKEVLAQADYLVTSGYGSFQASVIDRFLDTHTSDKLYSLCSNKPRR